MLALLSAAKTMPPLNFIPTVVVPVFSSSIRIKGEMFISFYKVFSPILTMLRSILRDFLNMYIGLNLMLAMWGGISKETLFLYGFAVFFFSAWFTLERFGLIPKLG